MSPGPQTMTTKLTNIEVVHRHVANLGLEEQCQSICDKINKAYGDTVEENNRNGALWEALGEAVDPDKNLRLLNLGFYDRLEQVGLKGFARLFRIKIEYE